MLLQVCLFFFVLFLKTTSFIDYTLSYTKDQKLHVHVALLRYQNSPDKQCSGIRAIYWHCLSLVARKPVLGVEPGHTKNLLSVKK